MEILVWVMLFFFLVLLLCSKRLHLKWLGMLEHLKAKTKASSSSSSTGREGLKLVLPPRRPWSNLPDNILNSIAHRLSDIEFLSFRGTCREWRRFEPSLSPHHHHNQTNQEQLWFLLYGKTEFPNCVLFDPCSKLINRSINIPELEEGVDCIASNGGWLLFYRDSNKSMFFFCPLSRAKIDLPKLPHYDIVGELSSKPIAAFSSSPTSSDCVVWVCTLTTTDSLDIKVVSNVLRRGANEWDDHREFAQDNHPNHHTGCATLLDGTVYLIDDRIEVASFSLEERQWRGHGLEIGFRLTPEAKSFCRCKGLDKTKLGLKKTDSLSICGTAIQRGSGKGTLGDDIRCIFSEEYKSGDTDDWDEDMADLINHEYLKLIRNKNGVPKQKSEKHKGVWIQPRFFQLPPNYSW